MLVQDDMLPRSRWDMGVITELIPSKDGIVRSVGLRTNKGITNRPIVTLYPLEVSENECEYERDESCDINERPKRAAPKEA